MHRRFGAQLNYANVMATVALFMALGGGAYAAVGGSFVGKGGVIDGCVVKKGGTLRVVHAGKKCPKGTVALAFDEQGQAGGSGLQGIQGLKGDQGIQGIQGNQGLKGDQGIQGIQGNQGLKGDAGIQGIQGPKGDGGPSGISGYQIVVGEAGSSSMTGEDLALAEAECPGVKTVLGGGYLLTDGTAKSYATSSGPEGSHEWFVSAASSVLTDNYAITAYAICATVTS